MQNNEYIIFLGKKYQTKGTSLVFKLKTLCLFSIFLISRSSRELQQAMDAASISGEPLDTHLYTHGCPPVDLLVRTSGERRLSDFMLVQSSYALLVFTNVLWPDFGFLDLVAAIMQYQRKYPTLQAARNAGTVAIAAAAARHAAVLGPQSVTSLGALKIRRDEEDTDSPCGVATPGSVSSPSSGSASGSEQELQGGNSSGSNGNEARDCQNFASLIEREGETGVGISSCLHHRSPHLVHPLKHPLDL